ncbi:MAG: FkbM family methyltransferase [Microvirga sp.]|jgi:FkbM family methyltransferase
MPRFSGALVQALRLYCEAERKWDSFLAKAGYNRKFFSQKGQDRWAVEGIFKGRRGGYFVELGGGDGRTDSNTYVLERDYDWNGVLIEANPRYVSDIARNRACRCIHACVDAEPGEADFFSFDYMGGILAEGTDYTFARRGPLLRRHRRKITRMRSRSLADILDAVEAPPKIDYLSLDVEGAEHRILSRFPFGRYAFEALTVERPTPAIHGLLSEAGYILDRVHRSDGFYVSRNLADGLGVGRRSFGGIPPKSF